MVNDTNTFLRRTKIVATLGPATDAPGVLEDMLRAGLDVARINFSHGGKEEQRRRIVAVRAAAEKVGRPVGILADLSGPKIRIESFAERAASMLAEGQPFALDIALDPAAGNEREVGCAYKDLVKDVKAGDTLLLADGYIVLEVKSVSATRIECVTRAGGELSNRKGLNKQGGGLSAPALTEKDLEYIQLAAEMGVDFLAVSFARDAADIRRAQAELRKWKGTAHVVAKIERHEAIDNLVRHPRRGRCGDGGARRPGRGNGLRGAHRPAEDHHRAGAGRQPRRHHGHADDGIDDRRARCRRAPRSATSPTRCWMAPMR